MSKITQEHIAKAVEYAFKNSAQKEERVVNFHRGCNTYGLIKAFDDNGFVNWCKNEECKSCKGWMKQFNEICKEQVNIMLEEWKTKL